MGNANTTSPHYETGRKETQELLRRWRPIEELKEVFGELCSVDVLVKYKSSDMLRRLGGDKYGYTIGNWFVWLECDEDEACIKEIVGWRPIYASVTPDLALDAKRRAKEYANGDLKAEQEYLEGAHFTLHRETRWRVCEGTGHFIAVRKEEYSNKCHLFVTAFGDQGIFAQPIRE